MTHFVDISKIRETIFTINSIILSGESFAQKYNVGIESAPSLYPRKKYWLTLKKIISHSCLELSVLMRNSKELLDVNDHKIDTHKILVCADLINSNIKSYDFVFIANKIIHAKSFQLTPVGSNKYEEPFEWWDGRIEIGGTDQKKKPWSLSINVSDWLGTMESFLNETEALLHSLQNSSEDILRNN
jgi:hypothetical protein